MCLGALTEVGSRCHGCRSRRRCFINYQKATKAKGMTYRRFVLSLKTVNGWVRDSRSAISNMAKEWRLKLATKSLGNGEQIYMNRGVKELVERDRQSRVQVWYV